VLDELIAVTQTVGVQHPVLVEHDRVFQPAALREAVLVQPLDLLHETEGPRARHFTDIRVLGKIDGHLLTGAVDGRMVETDRERQAEAVVGIEARPLFAPAGSISRTSIGRLIADEALGDRLLFNPDRLNQEDKRRRRAVQDRHFGGIEVDERRCPPPSPAKADIRCSMVPTLAPSRSRHEHMRVSPTSRADAGRSTTGSRSMRRKTMPVPGRGRAQDSSLTLTPECRPTPAARTISLERSLL
jgi:hypothetical protein